MSKTVHYLLYIIGYYVKDIPTKFLLKLRITHIGHSILQ